MDYKFESITTYSDLIDTLGVTDEVKRYMITAFMTGFDAGTLKYSDMAIQVGMLKAIFNDGVVN